jgi:F-type H+-transporting ATPase subunit alpha
MDEDTRKIIEHGKRIRNCLKQQELQPIPVPVQIVVLLALTSGLFDTIPIPKMQEAEAALQKINTELPAEIVKRLFSDKELSNPDREAIVSIAGNILKPFQENTEADQHKS